MSFVTFDSGHEPLKYPAGEIPFNSIYRCLLHLISHEIVSTPNVLHVLVQTFPTRNTIPPSVHLSLVAFIKDTKTTIAKRH